MASSPVGEIPVLITGDWSDLQDAINNAVSVSEAGAKAIAAAFSDVQGGSDIAESVTAATKALEDFGSAAAAREAEFGTLGEYLSSLNDDLGNLPASTASAGEALASLNTDSSEAQAAVDGVGAAIGTLGTDAETASSQVEHLSTPLSDVHEHGGEAESAIGELGAKLLELGEALAVAEVLKEFATDALETYANVQKATISLTALTGDASAAKEQIEGLKTVALDNALSFEMLVGADQKMTALGLSAEQAGKAIQSAADAAAATGNNFDRVAGAIERMALSGTAGAKQLANLGISANALGVAMGVAAGDVTTAFKALDQSERLTALETALDKFSGVAEQVAVGISGQWQNLKTQWEFIMEDMGAAMAPLATMVMTFLSGTVLPAVQSVVNMFTQLSPTMQEVVIVAGLAVPAIYAVSTALGALSEIFPAIGAGTALLLPVVGTIGLITAALIGMHLDGFDTAAMNLYHAIADNFPNIPEILGPIGTAFDALIGKTDSWTQDILKQKPLVAAGFEDMQVKLAAISPSTANLSISGWLQTLISPSKTVTLLLNQLAEAVQYIGTSYQSMAPEVKLQMDILKSANDQLNHSLAETAGGFTSLTAPVSRIAKDFQTLKDNLAAAQKNLGDVTSAFNTGQASAGQLADAVKAVDKAQTALNPSWITAKQAATDLNTATKDLNASQTTLDSLLKLINPHATSLAQTEDNLKQAQANAEIAAASLATAQQNLNTARAGGAANIPAIKVAEDALKDAEVAGKQAAGELTQAQKDNTQAQKDAAQGSKEAQAAAADYATMLQTTAKQALTGYATDLADVVSAEQKYKAAVANEMDLAGQLNVLTKAGQQNSSDYKAVQLELADAHQQVTANLKLLNSATSDYNTTDKTLISAQNAIVSSQQQLDSLYISQSIPNVKDLKGQLQDLRDAKTQVAADTDAQRTAESNLQDVLDDYLTGSATLAEVTQAQHELDAAKKQTTADNKDLTTTEGKLATAFGITKQAMQDIVNPETTMTHNTQDANAAFSALGIQSAQSLQTLADKATTAFNTITADGTSSPKQINDAQIKMLQAVQAAYVAAGTNLSTTQQNTLTQLLNQQTDFNNSMINQWHNLYVTVEGDVSSLSSQLTTDLFTGSHSFGKDALSGLEKIASAFLTTLIQPVTAAIGKFIAGALTNLISGFASVGQAATATGSTVQLAFFGQTGASAASGAAGMMGALSSAVSSLSGIISMVAGIAGAVAGIVGDVETAHSNTLLDRIEHETARMAIYLGDQGSGSILGLMWRLVNDVEYGTMEKGIVALSTWGLKDLDNISGNSTYQLQALQSIQINMQTLVNKGVQTSTSSTGTNAGTMGGTEMYLPGTPAVPGTPYVGQVPIEFTNIEDALNNYTKTVQAYLQGQDTAAQVDLAQQQVKLSQLLYDKQQQYNATLEKYLANPSPALGAQLAFAASQLQAAGFTSANEMTAGTPAGPQQLVTTVGELVTANTALANINNTLQYNVGLGSWERTALQNINNGIVACAGWLQGLAGMPGVTGTATAASTTVLSSLASYIGQNFASLEAWLLKGFGLSMPFPAIPAPVAVPSALGSGNSTGSLTLNMPVTVQGSVVGQAGMKQFTDLIGNTLINKLRNAGMKY